MSTSGDCSSKGIVVYTGESSPVPPPFHGESRLSVTVKMILDSHKQPRYKGRLVINRSQVYTVQLCGMMTELTHGDQWTDFQLYDGTGSIRGRIWSRDPEGWTDLCTAMKGQYYVVNATVTTTAEEPRLAALIARELSNHNELTVHFLTVIHEHLELERRYMKVQVPKEIFTRARLEIDKEAIVCFLSTDETREKEAGATATELLETLEIEPEHMRAALEALLNDGTIYNTISDYHYKMADN